MNRSIRLVSLFAIILTAILLVNLTVIQAFSEDKYAHNPRNMRLHGNADHPTRPNLCG